MRVNFIHTADWQVGKPFAGVDDPNKRAALQNERLAVIKRLVKIAGEHRAEFVLVAGDLFDSPHATKSTVAAACSAIGAIGIPVFAIPGNHDHGGAGSLWEQEFFQRERENLAPNLKILLKSEPVELENAVLFPCPLLRRQEVSDPTAWLRASQDFDTRFGKKPRIALAHGTVLDFGAPLDDEESGSGTANLIDLQRLPSNAFDYIALGDWHGTKQVAANAWYSGTPELDRFVKGEDHHPGNVLVVEAGRAEPPRVQCVNTGAIGWHEIDFNVPDDTGLDRLKELVDEKIGSRANEDLLRLHLSGSLGIEAATRLDQMIEAWNARLIRVKLDNQTSIAPLFGDSGVRAASNNQQWYFTISRGRKSIRIFTGDKEQLRRAVSRSGERALALDLGSLPLRSRRRVLDQVLRGLKRGREFARRIAVMASRARAVSLRAGRPTKLYETSIRNRETNRNSRTNVLAQ